MLTGLSTAAMAQSPRSDGPLSAEDLFERIAPSIWIVLTADGQGRGIASGSAVVMAPHTLVTNCHVLSKAEQVTVRHESVSHPARVEYRDDERDLCQLRVDALDAPAVTVAPEGTLRVGMRVYAVGAPRRLELTLSDGLVSSLRRNTQGELQAIQTSTPISPGSSGGGLFDAQARLVGITTSGMRESQNLNFAVPARWIADLPRRSQDAMARGVTPVRPRIEAESPVEPSRPPDATIRAPQGIATLIEYQLKDRTTGLVRTVTYRLDNVTVERASYNQGTMIELRNGGVRRTASVAGDFDAAMPPGGWIRGALTEGSAWTAAYSGVIDGTRIAMDLKARVLGAERVQIAGRERELVRIDYTGYTQREPVEGTLARNPGGVYKATAWYDTELARIVRFAAATQGGSGGGAFRVDELLELARME